MSYINAWAKLVKTEEEIPAVFKETLSKFIDFKEKLPHTIYSPPDKFSNKLSNPKLLCLLDSSLLCLEKNTDEIRVIEFNFADIIYVQRAQMLLYSTIRIKGVSNNTVTTFTVEFNTVIEKLFVYITDKIRKHNFGATDTTTFDNLEKFRFMEKLDFKFMTYGIESILVGDDVIDVLYQQKLVKNVAIVLKKLVTPAHLSILTSKELILISESATMKHGLTWTYIPRGNIQSITNEKNSAENIINISINLIHNQGISSVFSLTSNNLVSHLADEFNLNSAKENAQLI